MKKIYLILFSCLLLNINYSFATHAYTPENLLPVGVDEVMAINPYTGEKGVARKGTIGATIQNIASLNRLLLQSDISEQVINDVIKEIDKLIPSLKILGVFDLFEHEEWLNIKLAKQQWGRIACILLYFQKYPTEMNDNIKSQITLLKQSSPPAAIIKIIETLQ